MKIPDQISSAVGPLFAQVAKIFGDVHTGPDGRTYDGVRIAFSIAVFAIVAFTSYEIFVTHLHFNPIDFATAFGTLSATTGAAVAVKQIAKAEPPATPPDDKSDDSSGDK